MLKVQLTFECSMSGKIIADLTESKSVSSIQHTEVSIRQTHQHSTFVAIVV